MSYVTNTRSTMSQLHYDVTNRSVMSQWYRSARHVMLCCGGHPQENDDVMKETNVTKVRSLYKMYVNNLLKTDVPSNIY